VKKIYTFFFSILFFSLQAQISQVKDINPGAANNSTPTNLFDFNGTLLFRATDGLNGIELWKSDGTTNGTVLVKNIEATSSNSNPSNFTLFKGKTYFTASTGTSITGLELYVTDGTDAGTTLVKDIRVGTGNSNPQNLTVLNTNTLLFAATDGVQGVELWKTDGTEAGTVNVIDYTGATGSISAIVSIKGMAYISQIVSATGRELYKSDGTTAGSSLVKDINPGTGTGMNTEIFVASNNTLYFAGNGGTTGTELWKSDGTEAGTVLVKEINPGTANGNPRRFVELKGLIYFNAAGPEGVELWRTNGTEAGTTLVTDLNPGIGNSNPDQLEVINGNLYFWAQEDGTLYNFFKYDGTTLTRLKEFKAASNTVSTNYILNKGLIYFAADGDGDAQRELWITDGTPAGTVSVISKLPTGINPKGVNNLTLSNKIIYFTASDLDGVELFKMNPDILANTDRLAIESIVAYPNPVIEELILNGSFGTKANYTINDVNGRIVSHGVLVNNKIGTSNLLPGIHVVKIHDGEKQFATKFVKL